LETAAALAERLAAELSDRSAVIDGEIVSLDRQGKSQFRDLLFRRGSDASLSLHRRWRHWRCKFSRDRYTAVFSRLKGNSDSILGGNLCVYRRRFSC
jgi:hypothetical protein